MINGHLAGPVEWIVIHWQRRSIPCYADVTDGKLPCPHCRPGVRTGELGYVPIYRDDGRPIVVGIPPYNSDGVTGLEPGCAVKAYRGKMRGDPIRVVREKSGAPISVGARGARPCADIRPWLLTLWREQPLIDHFAGLLVRDDADIIRDATEKRRAADEAARELAPLIERQLGIRRAAAADSRGGPAELGDVLGDVIPPGVNGRHKPR